MATITFKQQTDEDFYKARNKALVNEIQHFLNPEEASLISLSDLKKILKPHNETYKGMQTIPVSLIVGSEGRYKDVDNQFFPKNAQHRQSSPPECNSSAGNTLRTGWLILCP